MKRRILLPFLVLITVIAVTATDQNAKPGAAQSAAEEWLKLLDAGNYNQAWQNSSATLKSAVTEEQWRQAMEHIRTPLGSVTSRKLLTATPVHQLPGAPDGDYVVIRYDTSFQNKAHAIETITPKLDDGKWKVSGYYIR